MGASVRPEGPGDRIQRNIAALRSQGASDNDIESYLRDVEGLSPSGESLQGFGGHGSGRDFGDEPSFSATMLDAIPFGTKAKAAVDAGIFGGSYDNRLGSAKQGIADYRHENPKKAIAATVLGAAAPFVATLGASAPAEGVSLIPKATLLARVGRGAVAGAGYGALQGASEAHGSVSDYADKITSGAEIGSLFGAGGSLAGAGIAAAARKVGLPQMVSNAATTLAERTSGAPNRFLRKLAASLGPQGEASSLVAQRAAQDQAAGFVPKDMQGVPLMPLNRAGPNVENLATGVVHGPPGPGGTILRSALDRQSARMRPSVQGAIADATGVAPRPGMQPLRDLIRQQSEEADKLYSAARAATEGQAVKSPTLDAVMQTPVGKQAYAWAVAQKANRMSPMPTANAVSPDLQRLMDMGVPESKAASVLGADAYTQEALPDPETLHYMKQYLANVAKLGVRDGAEGKLATQAQGAVSVWGMIRGELPQPWRVADEAFARKSKLVGLMNEGRNVFRTQVNPAGRPRAAIQNSLDAFGSRVASADAEGQQAARTGIGMAAQQRAEKLGTSVKSPGRLFGGENAQRMDLAFDDPEKAAQFQRLVGAWDQIQGQNQRILGNSATGGRVAEQAARAPDKATAGFFRELVHGNFGRAVGAIGGEAASAAEKAHRVAVDEAIAHILTSQNHSALEDATLAALLRQRLGTAGNRLLPRLAAGSGTAHDQ